MDISIEAIGIVNGYRDYHNAIWLDGELLGESHYDKRQRKHIAIIKIHGKQKKFYHDTVNGIKIAIERYLSKP